jgi:hypothetical protein
MMMIKTKLFATKAKCHYSVKSSIISAPINDIDFNFPITQKNPQKSLEELFLKMAETWESWLYWQNQNLSWRRDLFRASQRKRITSVDCAKNHSRAGRVYKHTSKNNTAKINQR